MGYSSAIIDTITDMDRKNFYRDLFEGIASESALNIAEQDKAIAAMKGRKIINSKISLESRVTSVKSVVVLPSGSYQVTCVIDG